MSSSAQLDEYDLQRWANQAIFGLVASLLVSAAFWTYFFFAPHSYLAFDVLACALVWLFVQLFLFLVSLWLIKRSQGSVIAQIFSFVTLLSCAGAFALSSIWIDW